MNIPRHRGSLPGRQGGLTLVELMVTIAVWSLLLAGLVTFIVNTNHGYRIQRALNTLNDDGRYIVALLLREMRMANHWGMSLTAADTAFTVVPPLTTPPVEITNDCTYSGTGAVTGSLQGLAVLPEGGLTTTATGACTGLTQEAGQGPVLVVRYADAARISDATAASAALPFVRARVNETAELFMGGGPPAGKDPAAEYATGPLSAGGAAAAAANYRYRQAYYLTASAPAPAGMKRVALSGSAMTLSTMVDNVERMNLAFLVDEPAAGGSRGDLQFMTPAQVSGLSALGDPWLQVRAAYVEILIRTNVLDLGKRITTGANTYTFMQPGGTGGTADYVVPSRDFLRNYHRRLFSGSVQFRNNRPMN